MCFSFWGTSSFRPPTGAPPLDPAGGLPSSRPPRLCSSKMSFKIPCNLVHRRRTDTGHVNVISYSVQCYAVHWTDSKTFTLVYWRPCHGHILADIFMRHILILAVTTPINNISYLQTPTAVMLSSPHLSLYIFLVAVMCHIDTLVRPIGIRDRLTLPTWQ